MIDIIVPVYQAKSTLLNLLLSIAHQKYVEDLFNVYLVVDADNEDYQEEINFIKDYYPIKLLKLEKNGGPAVARQYGIDHSNNEYIVFIDADDYFYDATSLYELLNKIKKEKSDLVVSNFIYQRDNEVTIKKENFIWLHGKIYRRKFLEENDIHFNETRANEDNGFNRLTLLNHPKISILDRVTYVYSENSSSITRRDNRKYKFTGLEFLAFNYNWAMNIMIEKNKNLTDVAYTSLSLLVAMYYYYLELYDEHDVNKILEWSKETYNIYVKYKELIDENAINDMINDKEIEYKNKQVNKIISFDEYLTKVGNIND